MHILKINHFIVLSKIPVVKYKSKWNSQISNLNGMTKLQKVHLSYFPP